MQRFELIEEYFYLVAKYLQYSPQLFLEATSELNTILNFGLSSLLQVNHKEAQQGILLFLQRLIGTPDFWPQSSPFRVKVTNLLLSSFPVITTALITALAGKVPILALNEKNGCFADVLWDMRKLNKNDFQVLLFTIYSIAVFLTFMLSDSDVVFSRVCYQQSSTTSSGNSGKTRTSNKPYKLKIFPGFCHNSSQI